MKTKHVLFSMLLFTAFSVIVKAQPGLLDLTFNQAGVGTNNTVYTTSIQSDGKIIVGGDFTYCNGWAKNRIARLNTDGSLDGTFDPGTGPYNMYPSNPEPIYTTAVQCDGKIIIGGYFDHYNGTSCGGVARLNADGTFDTTFSAAGGDLIRTIVIQSDGKIIAGGQQGFGLGFWRLNADGSLDGTFNPGTGANGTISTIAIQSDGKIIIGGDFTSYNGTPRNRIARLNADGTIDGTFNLGTGANWTVYTTAIQSDGKIIIGGGFTSYNGTARIRIARLNADGTIDGSFNLGTGADNTVNTTAIQSDGKIIIGGGFTTYNGTARNHIARLNADGTLDGTFDPGTGASSNVLTTAIQSDGKIIIGGEFGVYNGTQKFRVARILHCNNTSSSLLETACDSYTAPDGQIYSTSGIITAVISNTTDCDSIITINLTVKQSSSSSITVTVCDSYLAPDGQVHTTSGIKTAVIPNTAGCDSTITINLTVKNSTTSTMTETVCDSFTAPDGQIYTSSGIKTAVIPNVAGCDSIITVNLTVNHSTSSNISVTACESYTAPDGQIYTTSGIKTAVISNSVGCDSTITINLTININNNTFATQSNTSCDSYLWPINGQTYTSSGSYTGTIPNIAGCDSIITLNLVINNRSFAPDEDVTACNSYLWAINNQAFSTSGVYYDTIVNAVGCDSIRALNLTINSVTILVQPSDQTANLGDNVQFVVSTSSYSPTYQWQSDMGSGFQNIANTGQYSGVTTNTLTVSNATLANNNQQFRCIVTSQSCQDTTTAAALTVTDDTGIDNDLSSEIKIYPNPVSNELIIESTTDSEEISFEILNSIGQTVCIGNVTNKTIVLTTDFSPGVYVIRLGNGKKVEFRKIVKE